MRRRSELWLGVLLIALAANSTVHGQDTFSRPRGPVLREPLERWPEIGFDITVLDDHDIPVASLAPEQLDVRADKKPIAKFDLLPAGDEAQSVCIVVDTSGSTWDSRDVIGQTLLKLIDDLPPKDEVCLVDFSAQAYVDSDLTKDRKALLSATNNLKISGGSAINDAVFATANYLLKTAQFRSRAIILVSDGSDNASAKTERELFKVLQAPGGPVVYAITSVKQKASGRDELAGRRYLAKLTRETGGVAWIANGDAGVDSTVSTLVQALEHRYRLIVSAENVQNGPEHRLDVTLNKDVRKQKMSVNAMRGFDAP